MNAQQIFMNEIEKVAMIRLRAQGMVDPRARTAIGRLLSAVRSAPEEPDVNRKMAKLLHKGLGTISSHAAPELASLVSGKTPTGTGPVKRLLRGIEAARGPFLSGAGDMGDPTGFAKANMPRHQALQLLRKVPEEALSGIRSGMATAAGGPKADWEKVKSKMFR